MITVDGSIGEGGGQIIRTALALSLCLGKAFTINNIRIKRKKKGLAWQHLAAVKAAAEISNADVIGAEHHATTFSFIPGNLQSGNYHFDIGTAGSTTLVIQTILPALLQAKNHSTITLIGGTHNPLSPSFDFLDKAYFSVLRKLGATLNAELISPGYAPRGGGQIKLNIEPSQKLLPLQLNNRGEIKQMNVMVKIAGLPVNIAQREIRTVQEVLKLDDKHVYIEEQPEEFGPGNVVNIEIYSENITNIFTGYGQPHVPAERVAALVAIETQDFLNANVPVDHHLADQLLLPMALCGQGSFITQKPSSHTLTNIQIIKLFLNVNFRIEQLSPLCYQISLTKHAF